MKKHPFLKGFLTAVVALIFFSSVINFLDGSLILPGEKIAVIEITGIVNDSKPIIDEILRFKNYSSVKAIVLRINSPGGAVCPFQEIFKEIKKIGQKKKVVASMDSIATSGGYYIACAAEKILANPGTITGSIGALIQFKNIEGLLDKIGIKGITIKSGKHKDIGSSYRDMTPEEKNILLGLVNDTHQQFIETVAKERNIPLDKIKKDIADGRVFTGRQAKKIGLVDELGNLQDAIQAAAKMSGIKDEPQIIYSKKESSFLGNFIKNSMAIIQEEVYKNFTAIKYSYLP